MQRPYRDLTRSLYAAPSSNTSSPNYVIQHVPYEEVAKLTRYSFLPFPMDRSPNTMIPVDTDLLIEALGYTALNGYQHEVYRTWRTCRNAYYDYNLGTALSRISPIRIVRKGTEIHIYQNYRYLLPYYITHNNWERVQLLVKTYGCPVKTDFYRPSPLFPELRSSAAYTVRYKVSSLIELAVEQNNITIVNFLMDYGCDPNEAGFEISHLPYSILSQRNEIIGPNPLTIACRYNYIDIAKVLLGTVANNNCYSSTTNENNNNDSSSSFSDATTSTTAPNHINGANYSTSSTGYSLHRKPRKYANVNPPIYPYSYPLTPLKEAIQYQNVSMVQFLVDYCTQKHISIEPIHKYIPNDTQNKFLDDSRYASNLYWTLYGDTPLTPDIVRILLLYSLPPSSSSSSSPLSSSNSSLPMIRFDNTLLDYRGRSYLHVVCEMLNHRVELTKLFCKLGSDSELRCSTHGSVTKPTVLLLAMEKKGYDVAKVLIENGANIHARTYIDNAPFGVASIHIACYHGNLPFIKYLLDHGADINMPGYIRDPTETSVTNSSPTPLHFLLYRLLDSAVWKSSRAINFMKEALTLFLQPEYRLNLITVHPKLSYTKVENWLNKHTNDYDTNSKTKRKTIDDRNSNTGTTSIDSFFPDRWILSMPASFELPYSMYHASIPVSYQEIQELSPIALCRKYGWKSIELTLMKALYHQYQTIINPSNETNI